MLKFKKENLQFVAFMHLFSVPIRVKKEYRTLTKSLLIMVSCMIVEITIYSKIGET